MIEAYKGRRVDAGTRVFAYRNLHRACWSLKALSGEHKGKVIAHADDLILFGCELKVSEAGRQRVLRERRKNVHAGVVGLISHMDAANHHGKRKLSYNPYKAPSFTVNDEPVGMATHVHLDDQGKAWAIGSVA